jgi:hypothetical protein
MDINFVFAVGFVFGGDEMGFLFLKNYYLILIGLLPSVLFSLMLNVYVSETNTASPTLNTFKKTWVLVLIFSLQMFVAYLNYNIMEFIISLGLSRYTDIRFYGAAAYIISSHMIYYFTIRTMLKGVVGKLV